MEEQSRYRTRLVAVVESSLRHLQGVAADVKAHRHRRQCQPFLYYCWYLQGHNSVCEKTERWAHGRHASAQARNGRGTLVFSSI